MRRLMRTALLAAIWAAATAAAPAGAVTYQPEYEVEPPAPRPPGALSSAKVVPPLPPPVPSAIGCAARGAGFSFLVNPRRCVVLRQNRRDAAHEILMKDLSWSGWGRAIAAANGRWKRCAAGSCSSGPLKAAASRPILACGHFSYTRLNVHIVHGKRQRDYRLQLPAC